MGNTQKRVPFSRRRGPGECAFLPFELLGVFDCGSITQSDPIKQPELTDTWGHIAPTPNILGALSTCVRVRARMHRSWSH